MKYAVVTFGCRVNQADSLEIEGELRAMGAVGAPAAEADLVVVNTCSVTGAADQGARQTIRRVARDNPAARIVVTGCYATRAPGDLAPLPQVARIVPNTRKDDLVRDLAREWNVTTAERFAGGEGPCGNRLEPGVAGRTALTLRVQTGCDERCSYCIIPSTRGPGRSKPLGDIIAAVTRASAAGYREVAITGVHLGSYGRDLADGTSLLSLARALAHWPGDTLFRLSSLEPMDCSRELVELVAASPRLAPHFHLPLQHAADEMLAAMRRPYTLSTYRALVDTIRDRMPHASIGTDVIAGFPGESDQHAAALVRYLETSPLTHVHVFPYSHRPGTEASGFDGVPPPQAVRDRAAGARLAQTFRAAQVGTRRRALVVDDGTAAVTDNYLKLRLDRPRARNEWIDVVVTSETAARAVALDATTRASEEAPKVLPRTTPAERGNHAERQQAQGRGLGNSPDAAAEREHVVVEVAVAAAEQVFEADDERAAPEIVDGRVHDAVGIPAGGTHEVLLTERVARDDADPEDQLVPDADAEAARVEGHADAGRLVVHEERQPVESSVVQPQLGRVARGHRLAHHRDIAPGVEQLTTENGRGLRGLANSRDDRECQRSNKFLHRSCLQWLAHVFTALVIKVDTRGDQGHAAAHSPTVSHAAAQGPADGAAGVVRL